MKTKSQASTPDVQPGNVFEFPYPFVREKYSHFDGEGTVEVDCWRPGVRMEDRRDNQDAAADGTGAQLVTVIGVYKPGRYPARVFFTRQWIDPNGKIFGRLACRIKTLGVFRNLIKGYRHEFRLPKSPKLLTVAEQPMGGTN